MEDDLKNKNYASDAETSKSDKEEKKEGLLDDVAQKVNQLKEQLLRVSADFQNYQKRIEKEKSEWITLGQAKIIEKFLPFADDLQRAIQSSKTEQLDEKQVKWLEGFELIQKNLAKVYSDLGVKEVDCSNGFDPEVHEALMHVDSPDHKSGQIVAVLAKGYIFKDKVLRPARVSVAK
jgi:molecular chaperone GrpE